MKVSSQFELPRVIREVVLALHQSDEETSGRPDLAPEEVDRAREHLSRILINAETGNAHIGLLESLYHARACVPLPRGLTEGSPPPAEQPVQFRHRHLLSSEKARAVMEQGPEVLSRNELASLLLNPYALYDLADLITSTIPGYWRPALDEDAREYCERNNICIPIPGLKEPSGSAANT